MQTEELGLSAHGPATSAVTATILVVDDQPIPRQYLAALLKHAGHRVLEAVDGAQALDVARTERPDLAIVDALMPKIDGYQFARHLRADADLVDLPVILYTATYQQEEASGLAQACGISRVLLKPAEPEVVLATIREVLASAPRPESSLSSEEFHREHNRLLTDKVFEKVAELESVNARLSELLQLSQDYATRLEREIIDRRRAEEQREQTIKELEARNTELGQFTYTVSHDLKSPLLTINGFLGMLERDALAGNNEAMRADIAQIVQATNKMSRLLQDLLKLSRIGRIANPSVYVGLNELADEAASLLAGPLEGRGVELSIEPDLPKVFGDRTRLVEVLQNLIDNAIHFMGDQPRPRIEVGITRGEGAEVMCFVRDNGIGIDPRYLQKVFGLFEQLNPQDSAGTGIGLAVVKRIIEVHGGRIWVESQGVGQGSTFFFTLPEPTSTMKEGQADGGQ